MKQNNIAKFRKAAGLTQQQAADFLGWRQGRWSGYETGARTPDADDIKQILYVFDAHDADATFESVFLVSDAAEATNASAA